MAFPLTEMPPGLRQPENYKAIFDGVESTLIRLGSERMPAEQIGSCLDEWKLYENRELDDDSYYRILVEVVFYSGFRDATVTSKLPVIHSHFPGCQAAAAYSIDHVERILHDPAMIKNRVKVNACVENAKRVADIIAKFGSFRAYINS